MTKLSRPGSQIRHLIADALYPTKAYTIPSVCERYGLAPGTSEEAFSSKTRYVMSRLEKLTDQEVLRVGTLVVQDYPDDKLQSAIEQLQKHGHLISDITREHLAESLNRVSLSGKGDLLEMLRKHWPKALSQASQFSFDTLDDELVQHVIRNDDWSNYDILLRVGFRTSSQALLFQFLEDLIHPIRRSAEEQSALAEALNPILQRDGFALRQEGQISGYPVFRVVEAAAKSALPADALGRVPRSGVTLQ